jgi:hypothetical protein
MGMGEPLDNYHSVLGALKTMTDPSRFSLSPTRVTISTVGVVPRILKLIRDAPQVGLALSLHAPNQHLRLQIVPTAKAWDLQAIMDATTRFITSQNRLRTTTKRRHVLIEYVLLSDLNDSSATAHELGALLQGLDVVLNVIPYNPTSVIRAFEAPAEGAVQAFLAVVRSYGVVCMLRQELGQDIDGACGQLVIKSAGIQKPGKGSCEEENNNVQDVEDLGSRMDGRKGVSSIAVAKRKKGGKGNVSHNNSELTVWEKYGDVTVKAALGCAFAFVAFRVLRRVMNQEA